MSQSLASICLWTLGRTILLSALAWPICTVIERWLRGLSDSRRSWALGVLLAPFLFPELIVGYAYRDWALSSTRTAEWLCALLLLFRIVPVGVVVLLTSPSMPFNIEAIHCRRMILRQNGFSYEEWRRLLACYWQGPIRRALPALGLMSVVAFQEFELAALLQTASWTDWFIVSRRVGLDWSEILRQSLWPILVQAPLLLAIMYWLIWNYRPTTDEPDTAPQMNSPLRNWGTGSYLLLSTLFGCLVPLGFLAANLRSGIMLLIRQPSQLTGLGQEMLFATMVSLCAGTSAWMISRVIIGARDRTSHFALIRQTLLLPGLAGSLLLSLAILILFQQPGLRAVYDTPIPWIVSLIFWLLPRAVLVRLWIGTVIDSERVHLARMLNPAPRSKALNFRLGTQPQLLALGLLCYWAYLDLSTSCLLAPAQMPSGLVRLYNFMHFGRSSALSAESVLFFGMPVFVTFVVVRIMYALRT